MSKTVLVTGGAKRIGAAICRRFAEAGWHVLVHYHHSHAQARELAASLPCAEVIRCDLGNLDASLAMVEELARQHPDWRCLINSAAVFERDTVTALDPATNLQAMQINAATPAALAQAFLAHSRSRHGRSVVQLTDQKLANMNPDFFSYTMSKATADAAAQMLAMETRKDDRIFRLAPGAILASYDQTPGEARHSHRLNLLERRTTAAEIAETALFCAEGPLASGQEIIVDSGQHLLNQKRDVIYLAREGDKA